MASKMASAEANGLEGLPKRWRRSAASARGLGWLAELCSGGAGAGAGAEAVGGEGARHG